MRSTSDAKARIRDAVWDELQSTGAARFPYPPHGRIPNFDGARQAAERLFSLPLFAEARRIKVNPDAPQRPVRVEALRRGIEVFMPTPRLRAGFLRLDPAGIPAERLREAASLSKCQQFATPVPLAELPSLDALVVGSVAVGRDGGRCGKGEGYADLEYGILRSLGHAPVPVATTVHPLQVVDSLPRDATDVPVSIIATPEGLHFVDPAPPAPDGIDWSRLDAEDLDAMPVLRELAEALR